MVYCIKDCTDHNSIDINSVVYRLSDIFVQFTYTLIGVINKIIIRK